MREPRGFTLVEMLVVIMIMGILMSMAIPRYTVVREQARTAAMKMNLHNVQVVIEAFHAEKGYYADDFYEDGYGSYFPGGVFEQRMGKLPTNPWTNREMDPDEFNPEDYESEADVSNNQELGPNDVSGYYPGEIVYGVWEPEGVEWPLAYGLVGIGRGGVSIRDYNADESATIFVLHN